jgi:hypothetical protein
LAAALVAIFGVLFVGALAQLDATGPIALAAFLVWVCAFVVLVIRRTIAARRVAVTTLGNWPADVPLMLRVRVPLVGKTLMTRASLASTLTIADGWVRLEGKHPLVIPARDVSVGSAIPVLNTGITLVTPSSQQNVSLVVGGLEEHLAQLIDYALSAPLRRHLSAHAAAHPGIAPPRSVREGIKPPPFPPPSGGTRGAGSPRPRS